jgi:hypothetical protein
VIFKPYDLSRSSDCVGSEVGMAVTVSVSNFLDVAKGTPTDVYERFKGKCCLHHQGSGVRVRKMCLLLI